MNSLIYGSVFVLIIGQTVANYPWPIIPGYPCPKDEIENTKCLGAYDCLYPNPRNCNRFIQCNDAGLAYDMPCAANLHFNEATRRCDYPENANCVVVTPTTTTTTTTTTPIPTTEPTTPEPTTPEPTTPEPTTPPTDPTKGTDGQCYWVCPSTTTPKPPPRPFRCPPRDIINTKCLGPKDCLYTNWSNCNTFIQCTVNPGGRTGTPVVMPCSKGLKWNNRDKVCDYPNRATCRHN
ncbi:peritrophin-55-like [Oppia nitens]|uniref:peritrophin-55-like n=1 Tax=Oppia nitens TaxID=1686743 RepID=UPI0023DB8C86|nr:peritrophin-55-like [Oppia nitens]